WQKPAFERVHLLEIDAALEPGEQEQRVARVGSHRSHPAKHGLDMIDRVVALPCALIGALPLLSRHPRVRGGDVIEVVLVQVGVEVPAFTSLRWSSEPGSGVRQKNSSKSTGSSRLMTSMSRSIDAGVSFGKPRM